MSLALTSMRNRIAARSVQLSWGSARQLAQVAEHRRFHRLSRQPPGRALSSRPGTTSEAATELQVAGDMVAIASSGAAIGEGRDHRSPLAIKDQAGESRPGLIAGVRLAFDAVGGEAGLDPIEQLGIEDGGMVARMAEILVADLAQIVPVLQQVEQSPPAEGRHYKDRIQWTQSDGARSKELVNSEALSRRDRSADAQSHDTAQQLDGTQASFTGVSQAAATLSSLTNRPRR